MEDSQSQLGPLVQVGIVVRDIETAADRWAEVLGLPRPEVITTDPVEVSHTEYMGASTPARAKLAFFHLGQVSIELIEPMGGPSTWQDQLGEQGDSLHHVAFRVQGMRDAMERLNSQGIRLLQRGDYTGGRYAYLDAREALGTILELLEDDQSP